MLVDSLSRLKTLGLNEANDPEKPGSKYGKTIFDTDSEIIGDVYIIQNS